MTASAPVPGPTSRPGRDAGRPRGDGGGPSFGIGAMVLLAISAAVVFWAGLSLGGQTAGRNDAERVAVEAFTETYQRITDEYVGETDPSELLEGAICGMFETLDDPFSACMGADEYQSRFEDISGEFGGIGAVMNTVTPADGPCAVIGSGCALQVVEVLDDTPAQQAGLAAGDVIIAADGSSLEGLTITDAVLVIRGPQGSDVTLSVERDGQERELAITRERITTSDVRSRIIGAGDVGYLRLDSFSSNAASDFRTALQGLLDDGAEGIVVDVRDDPGGFVDAAVDITSQFLDDGAVFWEEDASGRQEAVAASGGGLATDPAIEVVLLVNGGTASASEILAGALQDAGRARLVGQPTFGKGTVQEWTQLPGENGGFRLSVAKWLTRNKTWIDHIGLTPDIPVEASGTRYNVADPESDPSADAQLARALSVLSDEPELPPVAAAALPESSQPAG